MPGNMNSTKSKSAKGPPELPPSMDCIAPLIPLPKSIKNIKGMANERQVNDFKHFLNPVFPLCFGHFIETAVQHQIKKTSECMKIPAMTRGITGIFITSLTVLRQLFFTT